MLDVRSPPEVEQHGTIPGAVNINVRTLEDTLALSQEDFENQVTLNSFDTILSLGLGFFLHNTTE